MRTERHDELLRRAIAGDRERHLVARLMRADLCGEVVGGGDAVAIDGGDSGLDLIAECLDVAAATLCPHGAVILQVRGAPQADAAAGLSTALTVQAVRTFGADRALVHLAGGSLRRIYG